jgi:hypothetical protein
MTDQEIAAYFIKHPAMFGRAAGYRDLRDIHEEWIKSMVAGTQDMTLQAHRGSYKTTCLCIAIAFLIMSKHDSNIIFMRKTDNDVAEVVSNVRRILELPITQEIYIALTGAPLRILKATNTEITTSAYNAPVGAAQLLGIGIGGSLTGKHADIIITDDIVNLKDRTSKAERAQTKAIYQELQNIRNRGGRFINSGTPWHKDDAFCLMPEPTRYDCYSTGLLTKQQIESLRQSMSPSLFAANYELRHVASEQALFTEAPQFFSDPLLLRDGKVHVDAAYGGEDYTAFTCAKRVGDTLYMYGRLWQDHVSKHLDAIVDGAKRLQCAPILCEDNGDKGFLAKEIIKNYGYKAATYHEKENKYIKISSYLRKWWPNIKWLEGTDRAYINQIMDYTEDAEHDDAPDSASVMARYYDRRSGEQHQSIFM